MAISEDLASMGHTMSERSVRLYLKEMDAAGLTCPRGRKGRCITELGIAELESSRVMERLGFFSARIDSMTYRMDFDIMSRHGSVVVNVTLVDARQLSGRLDIMCSVFEHGFAMGSLVGLLGPGERIGKTFVPDGMAGICTVCSITLNGVLLKYGVPTNSRFGGLLEVRDGRPLRFVDAIMYEGTTIDPLEVFIRSGMTDYVGAITTGNGLIGASLREFPSDSRGLVADVATKLEDAGLGAFMMIGQPSQTLLEIPVSEGKVGAVVIGGLNPVAVLEETGVRAESRALAGLLDYGSLFHFDELPARVDRLISFD